MSISQRAFEAAIRQRKRGAGSFKPVTLRDEQVRGLSLVIGKTAESWRFQYKPLGAQKNGARPPTRTLTLGRHAELTLEEARAAAVVAKAAVRAGGDPAADRKREVAQRVAARHAHRTNAELMPEFLAEFAARPSPYKGGVAVRPSYVADVRVGLRWVMAELCVEDLGPDAITARALARTFRNRSGTVWQYRLTAIRAYLDFAFDHELVEFNAARSVKRPSRAASRDRYLSADEIRSVWDGVGNLRDLDRDLIRFLICVPCRRGEAVNMTWADLNDDLTLWSQPGRKTKNGMPHTFALHPLAQEILRGRPRTQSPLVFPNRNGGVISRSSHLNNCVRRAAPNVEDWRLHDLRRTFATQMAEHGPRFPEAVIDMVLNHKASATRGGVLGVYQAAARQSEQAEVMTAWGNILAGILDPAAAPENVVRLS